MKKAKHEVGDLFFSKKHNKMFVVKEVSYIDWLAQPSKSELFQNSKRINQYLYTCKALGSTEFRRYYEEKLENEHLKLDKGHHNITNLKTIYGQNND